MNAAKTVPLIDNHYGLPHVLMCRSPISDSQIDCVRITIYRNGHEAGLLQLLSAGLFEPFAISQ
jgi:hypothetical protein